MTVPPQSAGALSRADKQELLRRILVDRISQARTEPASFAQERLWFLDRVQGAGALYNLPEALRLTGPLDSLALERALREIVRRHEALRTTFTEQDGAPLQVIAPFTGFILPMEDLSAFPADEREAELRRRVDEDAAAPFDLAQGPLFRARLLRLAPAEHALLLCMHHVVTDAWSNAVLLRELSALYAAFLEGREPHLPEPPLRYADFAAEQRARLEGEAMARELAWWTERLAGAPALLELPLDRPRPPVQSHRGASERVEIPAALAERLHAVARAEGATLYMVLSAAFQVLLGKYAGTDDVVMGTPIAGRTVPEVEGLIGFFVNTLVLRTDLSGDPAFREALRRVRTATLGAYAHQEVPFERLVAELHPERSLGHHPLFQAMFTLDETAPGADGLAELRVERLEPQISASKFDLLLTLAPENGGLAGELVYATDLFDAATIRRMRGHLLRVLQQAAADPSLPLSRLDPLDDAERATLLAAWNDTGAAVPAASIHRLFAEQAARTPGAVAVAFEGRTVTYAELDRDANRLARHLAAMGVGRESRVGLCLERGPEMIAALLAILKAGGAYVPLDPAYPRERLAFMLADSAVQVLVTQESLRAALPAQESGVAVVSIDGDAGAVAARPAEDPGVDSGPGGLAYVIYTSGSTGTPKGVAVEHRAVVRLVRDTDYVALGPADRIAQASNASFDAATFEVWGALLNGAAVVGIARDVALSPAGLAGDIRAGGITTLFLTTALFNAIAREQPDAFAPLTTLMFGGEAVDPAAVRRVLRAGGPRRLLHVYGPTENTTFSSWHRVEAVDDDAQTVPIGRAVAHSTLRVLDGTLALAPIGVPGELYVGGEGVARGYLGRAALTAERFVPDPFAARPGSRMYRTGDRVRWTAAGTVEYLSRLDGQVKVRGFRIEVGEIEAALRRHPGVADCTVTASADAEGGRRLVAYVVGQAGADALRGHLRGTLPDYMVPGAIVFLDAIPLTPNGKVDRRALPEPGAGPDAERFVAPRTPTEEVLASIWAAVLRRDRVGVDEDFFALGGHSLLVTRVISRIRAAFNVALPVRAVFEASTVELLARAVEAARADGTAQADEGIPHAPAGAPLPVSFQQRQLWLMDRMQPGTPLYNVPAAWRLRGPLDAAALERVFEGVVRRHQPLRTVFRAEGGDAVQVVLEQVPVSLHAEDLSALDADAREREVQTRIRRNAATRFDLERGPLFRAELLRLSDDEHLLLVCLHHVVCDGWSLGVLFRELAALYADDGAALPALPLRYADYAAWQRAAMAGERLERSMAWWRAHLDGAPTLLTLPTDRPRPAEQTFRGAVHHFALPAALAEALEAVARREGASLYMVLLPAFQVLLGRYARQDQVVVGSPIANRPRPEVEGLIGFFANAMALRTDLRGDPAFRELVARVREATLDAYAHQEVPFERLVEELQPERSLGHNPVFQAFFALHDATGEELRIPGLRVEPVEADGATAKFDVSLHLSRGADSFEGTFEYATDLFDATTIERMVGHLQVLLQAVAERPETRLSSLPLLPNAERRAVVEAWSGAGETFDVTGSLHGRFQAQAAARPDAGALTFDGRTLAYGELNARANRLARRLVALGVGPESRVGLVAERSAELIVGVLAILKAGAAYVPLDPAYPADRLAYMAEDSGIRVLLAQSALRDRVPAEGIPFVALDEDAADESSDDLGIPVDPSNLAYVIYTSGSTGRPKGVGVTHGNVLRLFASTESGFGFGEKDVWTLFHSYAFDFSVWEIWGALLYGGRLVVVPFDTSRDPAAFRTLLERERVTSLSQTPSAFKALARVDEESLQELSHLRVVVFGGEALQYESLRTWLERYGPKRPRLVNMYGITETTVHVTWRTVGAADLKPGAVGSSVGGPIPDLRAYVLDPAGHPAPIGVPGELHVGGAGLARGYLGRPALTAQLFVPDPFSGDAGARLYRSGDLARWRTDGTLEYLGRIDQQVKVRGFRIELGEIEAVLVAQPGVSAAAVIVRGEGEDAALVGYVVPSGDVPSAAALRDALRGRLPDYMVPAAFVPIDHIPLTANGKLDRKALPEPDMADGEAGDGYVAPRTPVEEVLAGIWAEVLGARRVGAADNFFEMGGHSLLATLVMARVREVLGVGVPLRTLFERPTVAQLAERVEALRRKGEPVLPPVTPVERAPQMPLSFAQERLWFLQRLQPESTTYNHPTALRLRGPLNAAALERALAETVRRQESLRTTFPERDGAPVQTIAPFEGFTLPVADLSALPEEAREAEVARRAAAEAARVWDLSQGPLFDAALLRLGPQEHVLILSMHHIVTDGWSMGVLFRQLSSLYESYEKGVESVLPPLDVQYADFAAWHRATLRGEALDREIGWWRERLAGAPALLEVPTDHPRGPLQDPVGARQGIELSAELLDRLRALGRREGATLYMVLLGAFQVLLGRYAGTDDVVVGSPIAGRTQRETEEIIGFFVNTLVLRTDLSGDPSFRQVLARVREATLGAWQHQQVPFERLVEALQPERSLSHTPLFQVMFAVVNAAEAAQNTIAGLECESVAAEIATTKFDLDLAFVEQPHGLRAVLEYSTHLFEPATIERMLAHLARVLEQVADDADRPVSRLALLDDAERAAVVHAPNATDRAYDIAPVHHLFAQQALRTPDAVALLHGGEAVTYAALDRRAEAVARRLRGMGVGAETLVGLSVDRTPELLASVLGIWKAGGAYVPLDPEYPADRLAWMVEDARLSVIVAAGQGADAFAGHAAVLRADLIDADDDRDAPVESSVSAEHLAYVIYTSGSTGRPKGVLVQHASLANLLAATRESFGVGAGDVMPALASYSFDIWLFEALLPLTSGAAVRLLDRERVLDVPSMLDEAADATLLHAVPALMRQVAQVQRESGRPSRIRRLFVGGDLVPADLLAEMVEAMPAARTHVLYGPTEATILASAHPVAADGTVEGHPIGTPFGNMRLYVCDPAGSPQPAGLPGELLIGGLGVARGYLNRPALTAERFVPDPFGPTGGRLYRTGDRVRRTAGGSLEYLGRLDGQVKIRGFRIEPGEIEAALRRHPEVRECVVVAREDAGQRRLVAYVAGDADAEALKAHLRRDLPDYMVPAAFVVMQALPVTPNGKLDRRALPAPEQPAGAEAAPPRDALEARVAEVWAEVLGAARIGVHDNFFDLGGTSLLLYRVFSKLRELRADLRVVDLFRFTTVEELAAYLGAAAEEDDAGLAESRARAQERRAARRRVRG